MIHLYELTDGYKNLSDLVSDEVQDEVLLKALETLKDSIEEKAQNIAYILADMDTDISGVEYEIKRLQARKKAMEGNKDRLKQYLFDNFKKCGIDKIKTATHTISIQNNKASVNIIDIDVLPKDYQKHIDKWEPDKNMLYDLLKSGQTIPGAELVQSQSLRVR
ncbi:siphovirus Gp157 family protein [Dehalobacter sp. DCM]|uniref:siphovirus Gp157 family protein n=1 Tax=Dehalobacter sp. DCM TaxID=2907827 RepID=UPI0030814A92|nr:siphovirus Gp157 family protein [Dehalobacter sp. DCM]